jgi:nucleoside-diphosphate-sugar epimerase
MSKNRSVLVTGGGGFIGSHLVRGFLAAGHRVSVLDNFLTGRRENLEGIEKDLDRLIEGDIRDPSVCREAVKGVDLVSHQAALPSVPRSVNDPHLTNEINIGGTLNMLLAARDAGVGRFAFASSSSIYGNSLTLPKVETMCPSPISPYALQKLTGETYCHLFHRLYAMETVALRYFNVFGPRQDPKSQYAAVIPLFITAIMAGNRQSIFGNGEQSRDFTFVENVVHANMLCLDAPSLGGERVNIACGERYSLNRLLQLLGEYTGKKVSPDYVVPRPGDVKDSLADIGLAEKLLGYKPVMRFEAGLKNTVAHFASGP